MAEARSFWGRVNLSDVVAASRMQTKTWIFSSNTAGKATTHIDNFGRSVFVYEAVSGRIHHDGDRSGYRLDWVPDGVSLAANGCIEVNLLMKVDRRVQGTVRDDKGAPVSGALVQMVSTNQQLKRWEQPVRLDVSDESGHYTIDGIPPGEYYLGVNIESTPTREHPYPSTYYPNTPDLRQAIRIGIVIGASVRDLNLSVPRGLSLVTIHY